MKHKSLFAALLLVAGMLNAQNRQEVDGVWYLLDEADKTATVTFRPSDTDPNMVAEDNYMGRLNIPSVISVYSKETSNYEDYTVTAIGDSAFAKSPYLTAVIIPSSVKTLGLYLMKDFNANGYGDGLLELTIADGDEPIEFSYRQGDTGEEFSFQEAAMTCTYLYLGRNVTVKTDVEWDIPIFHTWGSVEEVVFGEKFTEVPLAFCPYCRNLWSIQINSTKLLEAGPRMFAFLDEDKPKPDAKGITLYVPYGMKDIYAADEYWSRFSIEEMDEARR
nr:leucine-rich repeat domain-containing protein [Paludibacteraceae bacterium]